MISKYPYIFLFLTLCLFAAKDTWSQSLYADTTYNTKEVEVARHWYDQYFSGANNPLYNGYEYIPYNLVANGTPYYQSAQWTKGSVFYGNKWYRNVLLVYDIMQGKLVVPGPYGLMRIALMDEKIKRFSLYGRLFIRATADEHNKYNGLPEGFYEILVEGKTTLVARRTKSVTDPSVQGERKFFEKDYFYVEKGGKYYPVSKKRELLRVYSDQGKNIKYFMRRNRIKYAKDPETALIKITKFYNQE